MISDSYTVLLHPTKPFAYNFDAGGFVVAYEIFHFFLCLFEKYFGFQETKLSKARELVCGLLREIQVGQLRSWTLDCLVDDGKKKVDEGLTDVHVARVLVKMIKKVRNEPSGSRDGKRILN
ncbi:hypothetical protein L596_005920 [Steinernema carpocapsae]|uniref:Uncharacterized protein n=1 Tax=Steinernema carpocapsae TaxID=34508 RepID=A0A4U8V200_STECR|nr:hypothetical protein L596_005920 [Steinernema carpocapsae]